MSLKVADNFSYQARKPLDERTIYKTKADMSSTPDSYLYNGIIAFNEEDQKYYTFNSNNTLDSILGKWREFNSGSGAKFTAAVDTTVGSATEGHLIITFLDGTTIDAGYVLGSDIATIAEYQANTSYSQDAILYLGDKFARVISDYTTGAITTTIEDLFNTDSNLVIMSHNLIDDSGSSINKTYSSDKIESLFAGVSSSFKGSAKTDNTTDLPSNPNSGDWILIEDCVNSYPGQAAIAVYNGTSWDISPIPAGTFTFPEPVDDNKLYFRTRANGGAEGSWIAFNSVDGSNIEIKVNIKDSSIAGQGSQIPKKGELVWDSARECLLIGDGLLSIANLRPFYENVLTSTDIINALNFTPENVANKGQANGYAPLDANGKVPAANLPASLTDTYSKAEIDSKDTNTLTQATTLVNTEATTARANEAAIRTDLNTHTSNNSIHVTQAQKDSWDAKIDASDLTNYDNHISDTVIHVTQADKDKWNGMNKSYYVLNKSDLPLTGNQVGNIGFVQVSAAGVTPVVVDQYLWNGTSWVERDVGQVSLSMTWGNISGRPSSTPLALDNTVGLAHNHTNKLALDKIGQSTTGAFTFDGQEVGIRAIFVANQNLLPTTGTSDTLYIVYEDSRVRNYPSISVWRDDAYQILGRGTQDAPPQVGDMSILQNEYFSVAKDTKHRIKVKQNQYFAFLPLEILKEIPGKTAQNRNITDFSNPNDFEYDEDLFDISSSQKLIINLKDLPTTIDTVSDQYHSYVDVDLNKYKDIEGIA